MVDLGSSVCQAYFFINWELTNLVWLSPRKSSSEMPDCSFWLFFWPRSDCWATKCEESAEGWTPLSAAVRVKCTCPWQCSFAWKTCLHLQLRCGSIQSIALVCALSLLGAELRPGVCCTKVAAGAKNRAGSVLSIPPGQLQASGGSLSCPFLVYLHRCLQRPKGGPGEDGPCWWRTRQGQSLAELMV